MRCCTRYVSWSQVSWSLLNWIRNWSGLFLASCVAGWRRPKRSRRNATSLDLPHSSDITISLVITLKNIDLDWYGINGIIWYPFRIFRRSWVVIEFQVLSQNVPDSSCNQIFLSTCSKAYWRRRRRCLQPVSNSTTQFHPKDHSNDVRSFMMLYVTLLKNDSILDDYEVRQTPGCRIAQISQIRFDDPWWSWDET